MINFLNVSRTPSGYVYTDSLFLLTVDVEWIPSTWEDLMNDVQNWQYLINNYYNWKQVFFI